jgi:putative oxidoreductase
MGPKETRSDRLAVAVARVLMAGIFIHGGWNAFKEPGPRTKQAEKLGLPKAERLVRANGLAMAAGGTAVALGIVPQAAAAGLIASLVPTTLAGHRFWEEQDERARRMQLTQFLKNLGLIGGLVLLLSRQRRTCTADLLENRPTTSLR